MNIESAKQIVNSKFTYELDEKIDSWEVLDASLEQIRGDCEDYALTFIWLVENKSLIKFLWALLSMKYIMWYVKTPNNYGHALVYIRENRKCIDNIQKDFKTKQQYKELGYKFKFPFVSVLVLPKLLVGLVVKGIRRI